MQNTTSKQTANTEVSIMNEQQALAILAQAKALLGRNYKSAIRQAWFDGNYDRQLLRSLSGELQRVRNVFGPSWLIKARP